MKIGISKSFFDDLREIIEKKDEHRAREILKELHPADIAEIYTELETDEAKFLFLLLDPEMGADVVAELEEDDRERFLSALPGDVIARNFIDYMDSDDAADAIADLSEEKRVEVLSLLEDVEQAGDIVDLLHYDENTAGGIMAKELISVQDSWTIETCLKEMRKQAEHIDDVYYIYVVNKDNVLQGILSLKKLLLRDPNDMISSAMDTNIISVNEDTDDEEVAAIMEKYNLVALPVVDDINRLVGRITIDDIVDVIREEAERDYQLASGISEDIEFNDGVTVQTRARLPWLLIGLVGGILASRVLGSHESDIDAVPAMAFYIPIIAAMGGNVGVQSAAIVVQGLAAKSISFENTGFRIFKEFTVAFINGLICAGLVFLYNYYTSDNFALTITVSLALFSVILFASVFGTLVPLALNRIKIDPALATGPFITTINDVLGLLIYLNIGKYLFSVL